MIYLDNNASTEVFPEAKKLMLKYLGAEYCHNPSAKSYAAKTIRAAIEKARAQVAALINADADEIFFTSGATEGTASIVLSHFFQNPQKSTHLITSVEHNALRRNIDRFAETGQDVFKSIEMIESPVDENCLLRQGKWVENLRSLKTESTPAMAHCMVANNETGVIMRAQDALKIAKDNNILTHSDAVAAQGKTALDVKSMPFDFMTFAGHKIHAPKGVGAIYVRKGAPFTPLFLGGGQEKMWRSGTENVASIAAFGYCCELLKNWFDAGRTEKVAILRDYLEMELLAKVSDSFINGGDVERICTTSNICFPGTRSDELMLLLDSMGVVVSAGSACASKKREPSHVLRAMGLSNELAGASIRISLSYLTKKDELERAIPIIVKAVEKCRALQN